MKKFQMNFKFKNGQFLICMFTFFIILLVSIFAVSVLYIQININLQNIKLELPGIIKNVALQNCDIDLLKNDVYSFDLINMRHNINKILKKDYNNIKIETIVYDNMNNNFNYILKINITPIIRINNINNVNIKLNGEVKFKVMEVVNSNL